MLLDRGGFRMAAQRFGGQFSPDGNGSSSGRQTQPSFGGPNLGPRPPVKPPKPPKPRGRWRATLLFLSAFSFLFPAFGDDPNDMLLGLIAGGLLILASWLSKHGLIARAAFEARKVARRPAIPRILFGAIATGTALFIGGIIAHGFSITPFFYAVAGFALHLGAFGMDPMRDKGMEGIDRFQTDRVARAVADAERTLAQMKDAILRARDRQLEARVERFAAQARDLMKRVEEDPGDLTAARKYLSVYLQGARDATIKFTDLWVSSRDTKAREEYESLLTDLETTFATRSQLLIGNDRTDLDIEIGVLRDRLKFETPSNGG